MHKHQILLVEDSKTAQTAVAHFLIELHCNVDITEEDKEALAKCDEVRYDLILMDLGLHPGQTGFEISKMIRANSLLNKDTPILALSIHAEAQFSPQLREAKMNGFIAKPLHRFEAEELVAMLDNKTLPPIL